MAMYKQGSGYRSSGRLLFFKNYSSTTHHVMRFEWKAEIDTL